MAYTITGEKCGTVRLDAEKTGVVVTESVQRSSKVTSNPVEKGSDINDHVINDPVVFSITAELPDSTSALIPSGAPLLGSFHIAEDAGVVNGCETGDGVVKFYSKEIPTADISTCIILFGKGGGGESDLTVATREQLGHVKIGNGIEVTEDGTISANAKVSEDQIATSDDTSEMLKEIYGE